MKILILTYFFHPQPSPRAFRAYELAKELARRGHAVTVYAPETGGGVADEVRAFNVRRIAPGLLLNRTRRTAASAATPAAELGAALPTRSPSRLRDLLRTLLEFVYLGGFAFEYAFTLRRALIRHEDGRSDLVISVGLPISVHLGAALYRATKKTLGVFVADYGDPFSQNPQGPRLWHYRIIERAILRRFDHVTVPLASAIPAYDGLVPLDRVHVIPQGVDFSIARRRAYAPGAVVRFCYSGVFYTEIRNPRPLLESLVAQPLDFEFTIYTDFRNTASMSLIEPYRALLGRRLVLRDLVPREVCIFEMSGFDFLVNQRNATGVQAPSKLIDYGLAGRPVFSFDQDCFDAATFQRFLHRDFSGAEVIDLDAFDVRKIAARFESLARR